MSSVNRHRVLVISQSQDLRNELVTLLSGYGYFTEYCKDRLEGLRQFRRHKQAIVIVDLPAIARFPQRWFRTIHTIRKNAIVLVAAHKHEDAEAFSILPMGAYDVLNLPLKTDFLKLTLLRAQNHHRLQIENIFVKNTLFFGLLMLPLWAYMAYLLIK